MDQANQNMRQRRWLDVVKDYDYEILYHPGNANVVADDLIHKVVADPIRGLCLRMTVITPLLKLIREAQIEAMKEEHRKSERIVCRVASFDYHSHGLLTLRRRVGVPYWGGVCRILMEEAHKSRLFIHPGVTNTYRDLRPDY